MAKDIDHDILERREFLEHIAVKFPLHVLHNQEKLQTWLEERYNINPLFSLGLFILDRSGRVLADYPVLPDRVGFSFADRDYFQQASKGEFAIGRPIFGRVSKVPLLPMALPLRDSAGNIQAILGGVSALQSRNFMEAFYSTRIGTTGGLVLVSPHDNLFIGSSKDANIMLKPTPNPGVHPQHDQAMKGFRGVGIDTNAGGIEELAAIASIPSSGWFVVAHLPTAEAFASITRMWHFILKNTMIVVPIFLFLAALGLRYQLRPLMKAAQHADRMTQDEIPLQSLPVVRNDEVGHLTMAFNRVLSKLLESRADLEGMAYHDTLTGLPNRRLLADRMQQALSRVQRSQRQIALLFLDLDGFKPLNDRLGHAAGDAALCEVAERLCAVVRREDTVARVGGDEFVILLSDLNTDARAAAELVANKCLGVFHQPFVIHDQAYRLGTSIGIAMGHAEYSPDQLLIAADQAMYRAKEAGRGQFFWAMDDSVC
ncbi:MAG: hypothetical protein QG599_3401 [Pseudomonadota bacterium]|nr:hypothetical protein [Pseudomonadota bacterium]